MNTALLLWLCAPASAVVYMALCLRLGDRPFFSSYSMYSRLAERDHGAVPVVMLDGDEADIDRCERISGIAIRDIYPRGLACSLEWRVREIERWVTLHPAAAGSAPGPVKIEIGFWILRVDKSGAIQRSLRITARGQGWRVE